MKPLKGYRGHASRASFVLVCALLLTGMSSSMMETAITLRVGDATGSPGGSVDLEFSLAGTGDDVATVNLDAVFDDSVLSLVGCQIDPVLQERGFALDYRLLPDPARVRVLVDHWKIVTFGDGTFGTCSFIVLIQEPGSTEISLTRVEVGDNQGNALPVELQNGIVTIADVTPPPTPTLTPTPPIAPEFQVNTYTTDFQIYPSVAAAPSGQFVVVWASYDQDLSYGGIFGQRYDTDGSPLGSEFQVNTTIDDDQYFPAVTADAAGDFVVVWASRYQDGDNFGVFGQRFAADGTPAGDEFQVNTYAYGYQGFPAVASAPDGAFLVVWMSDEQDGSNFGVFGQRYDTNGDVAGAEFLINTYVEDYQGEPNVAADGNGHFVVVWHSFGQDGDGCGIFGQKLNGTGDIVGHEFQLNTFTQDDQIAPAVAADARGNFVVAWQSNSQDASNSSVRAQRFNASGARLDSEFEVHAESADRRSSPSLAADPNGSFVVAWTADNPVSGQDVFARHFDSSGSPTGAEFRVNTYTTGIQAYQAVAADAHGNFEVVWSSFGQDGDGFGIFARSLDVAGLPPSLTPTPPPTPTGPTATPTTPGPTISATPTLTGVTPTVTASSLTRTPTVTRTPQTPSPTGTHTFTPTRACTGDCDGGGTVTIDELIKGVNIALGTQDLGACPSFDSTGDGSVTIDELVRAVNATLSGCPPEQ